jgi:hypothetical protein
MHIVYANRPDTPIGRESMARKLSKSFPGPALIGASKIHPHRREYRLLFAKAPIRQFGKSIKSLLCVPELPLNDVSNPTRFTTPCSRELLFADRHSKTRALLQRLDPTGGQIVLNMPREKRTSFNPSMARCSVLDQMIFVRVCGETEIDGSMNPLELTAGERPIACAAEISTHEYEVERRGICRIEVSEAAGRHLV